ncbi:MAG TPA: helix-turn-helix transcriptional regulator [Anaerolineales bacterium]|nr:helix-turn-helix transcriptional regulator [Anaerolineales bacterium]
MKLSVKEIQQGKLQALLKQIRQEKGIRQVELAEKLGVPQSYVSKYESGDRRLDVLELRQVCDAIGVSLQEFVQELENSINEAK